MVNTFGVIIVFIAMLTWAISSVGYKFTLGSVGTSETDPISSLAIRILMVFLVVFLINLTFDNITPIFELNDSIRTNYWLMALLSAALLLCGDITYFFAFRYIDSSRVFPLTNTQTIFTFPFAYFFFGEPIHVSMWISAGLMIVGVFFMGSPDSKDKGMEKFSSAQQKRNRIFGICLGILTGFFFATQYLTINEMNILFYNPFANNLTCIFIYFVVFWSFILINRKHIPHIHKGDSISEFKSYIYTGLFGSLAFGIGDALYQYGAIANGNSLSIIIASGSPVFNQLFAILFLKEKFRPLFLIGVICIVVANIIVIF
jgi:drug/metabolite transporter (DMT)-like permease